MTEKLKLICVGAIAGAFGVKGEVRLKSFTSNPTDIANYAPLLTEGEDKSFDVVITGQLKNGLAVRLSGIVNKENADQRREQSYLYRVTDFLCYQMMNFITVTLWV